jgi:hypothetical protein
LPGFFEKSCPCAFVLCKARLPIAPRVAALIPVWPRRLSTLTSEALDSAERGASLENPENLKKMSLRNGKAQESEGIMADIPRDVVRDPPIIHLHQVTVALSGSRTRAGFLFWRAEKTKCDTANPVEDLYLGLRPPPWEGQCPFAESAIFEHSACDYFSKSDRCSWPNTSISRICTRRSSWLHYVTFRF